MSKSSDVLIDSDESFKSLGLSDNVVKGLQDMNILCPSPIQLSAIPEIITMNDIIIQAKAGTGKTCVFAVHLLEDVRLEKEILQSVVITPTREIAMQICGVLVEMSKFLPKINIHHFIGGMPIDKDIEKCVKCQIAVGTPGRMYHLMKDGHLRVESVRILVLDEADKLIDDLLTNIIYILSCLSLERQIVMVSATFPENIIECAREYMSKDAKHVCLNLNDKCLLGVSQYSCVIEERGIDTATALKLEMVVKIVTSVTFNKCIIFTNTQIRSTSLCHLMKSHEIEAEFVNATKNQNQRKKIITKFSQSGGLRILICTDLISRGIDNPYVDLVVNFDMPNSAETYLHRIGRAGRFGSLGASITFVELCNENILHEYSEHSVTPFNFDSLTVDINLKQKQISKYIKDTHVSIKKLDISKSHENDQVIIYKNPNYNETDESHSDSFYGLLSEKDDITNYFQDEQVYPSLKWISMDGRLPPPRGIDIFPSLLEEKFNSSTPKEKKKISKECCKYCSKDSKNTIMDKLVNFINKSR